LLVLSRNEFQNAQIDLAASYNDLGSLHLAISQDCEGDDEEEVSHRKMAHKYLIAAYEILR
jgi:hypothetical protein